MNLKAFDYEITPEHQTNIKENQSVVSSSDLKDDDSILLAEITIEENKKYYSYKQTRNTAERN